MTSPHAHPGGIRTESITVDGALPTFGRSLFAT